MTLRRLVLSLIALPFLMLTAAEPVKAAPGDGTALPNLASVGAGWFDVFKNDPRRQAFDMRLEHRWGMSLLPMANNYFRSWDKYFQIHPMVGAEVTHRGQLYGNAGFAFDILLGRHIVITPTELVGLYFEGDGKDLGSVIEFRSTIEAGYRFDNEMRVTAYLGHVSNAGIGDINPGAEILGAYVHIPTTMLLGR